MSATVWATNRGGVARRLSVIDRQYASVRMGASGLCLADKVEALRGAKERRQAAYDAILTAPCKETIPSVVDDAGGCLRCDADAGVACRSEH